MSLRLFAALDVPASVHAQLTRLQRGVDGAAWRPPENFHVTLAFFGDVDEPDAEALDRELVTISAPGFALSLRGAGWFGGARPSSLWLGVEGAQALPRLARECERAAKRAGVFHEARKYTPHVTLAYCKGTSEAQAIRFTQQNALVDIGPIPITAFHLYSSWPGKRFTQYVAEADYPLTS